MNATSVPTSWFARMRAAVTPKRFANGRLIHIDRGLHRRWRDGFRVWMQFGPGAGYVVWNEDRTQVLVHGRSAHIAWRSGSRSWCKRHAGYPVWGGGRFAWITGLDIAVGYKNANRTPWMSH